MPAEAHVHVNGPIKMLTIWVPGLPTWNKHSRVGTASGGRRFLTPDARAYRAAIVAAVRPVLPKRPWFTEDLWYISYIQFMAERKFDDDQWAGGIRDDVVEAGLAEDDAYARTAGIWTRAKGPEGVFIIASQECAP